MYSMRPMGFSSPPVVVKNLLIVNGLVLLAQFTIDRGGMGWMYDNLALHDIRSPLFKPHQLITYMFMHGGLMHIIGNLLVVWLFGSSLEDAWGPKRFLMFYMFCGIFGGITHLATLYFEYQKYYEYFAFLDPQSQFNLIHSGTVGASGAVFGILAAFGYLFPNRELYLYAIFPIKAKWLVGLIAAGELYLAIQNSAGDTVAHWAHLGGALAGILLVIYWNKTNRRRFY
jgi:membrane associated rhomboid family serine protease